MQRKYLNQTNDFGQACLCAVLKPGLREPQLPVEMNVTLVSSSVVERPRCAIQVSSVADNKRINLGLHEPQLQVE